MQALLSHNFVTPEPLQAIPGSNVKQDKFYDQIAYWNGQTDRRKSYTQLIPYRAGVFDYFDVVYRKDEEDIYHPFMKKSDSDEFYASYNLWRTYQMSDHLPMWIEFQVDFSQEYLNEVEKELIHQLNA